MNVVDSTAKRGRQHGRSWSGWINGAQRPPIVANRAPGGGGLRPLRLIESPWRPSPTEWCGWCRSGLG